MLKYFLLCLMIFPRFAMAADSYDAQMRELIELAKKESPEYPFSAMIVDASGKEICRGVNARGTNRILHGEIQAINNCVEKHTNLDWPKLTLITTAEPCPMCQGAIIWTGIGKVVFGTSINTLIKKGWNQINISSVEVTKRSNFNRPQIIGGVLSSETDPLFVDRNMNNKTDDDALCCSQQ